MMPHDGKVARLGFEFFVHLIGIHVPFIVLGERRFNRCIRGGGSLNYVFVVLGGQGLLFTRIFLLQVIFAL